MALKQSRLAPLRSCGARLALRRKSEKPIKSKSPAKRELVILLSFACALALDLAP